MSLYQTDTNKLRKAGLAVFLAVEESVAQDLSNMLNTAADEIDNLRKEIDMKNVLYD